MEDIDVQILEFKETVMRMMEAERISFETGLDNLEELVINS